MTQFILNAPINNLSYGIVSRSILHELSKICDVGLYPIGQIYESGFDLNEKNDIIKSIDNFSKIGYNVPCIKIWHQFDLHMMPKCSKRIGFPIFELNEFNKTELYSINSCDELFVCSNWAKNICLDNKVTIPIHVIPLGVDTNIFKPTTLKSNDIFKIVCIGKTEIRKGHDILPNCIINAMDGIENYEINIMWTNAFMKDEENQEWERYYKSILGNRVNFIPRLPINELVDLMSSSNVLISLTKAEGWNLPVLEALACGTDVIVTNYSGHTEYCNENNSNLINIKGMESAYDGVWFHGDGEWAIPDVDHAAELLRAKYEDWVKNGPTVNQTGLETAKKFSWQNTAQKILEAL